ncbi:hypothetical protein SVA_0896 [Sulfurifustis variabilis]|uniref:Uncharacterized protein n=1 Tax=Sulfurifustis variabilis TaxID=1675686 RepID=A0A1B4V2D4_9GAMM|nr:hypothetical protein SVA_0896 [Sulfurifustis variabilis]
MGEGRGEGEQKRSDISPAPLPPKEQAGFLVWEGAFTQDSGWAQPAPADPGYA